MATTAIPTKKVSGGSFLLEERATLDESSRLRISPSSTGSSRRPPKNLPSDEIVPNIEKMEHKDFSITRALLKKAGELGLSGVEIPEAYGGLEMDKVTAAVIADHIAKYAGFATTWGSAHRHRHAAHRLFRNGRAEEEISAAAGRRRNRRRLCLVGSFFGIRCPELPRPRGNFRPMASTTS